jgi:hypothetical protein
LHERGERPLRVDHGVDEDARLLHLPENVVLCV